MEPMSASRVAVRELFVHTARVVRDAIADDAVGRSWDSPSVLEEQTVGGLAGHLARGGVWVVDDYLSASLPEAPFVSSVAEYFVEVDRVLDAEGHRQLRERGAQVAAQGHDEVSQAVTARLSALIARLVTEPPDRRVGVAGGAFTMLLDEYLKSRIVEQVVHLDDLARSVGREPWPVSFEAQGLVLHIGADIGRIRSGAIEMIRCLYRTKLDPILPVI
jgi:hypothetical protein